MAIISRPSSRFLFSSNHSPIISKSTSVRRWWNQVGSTSIDLLICRSTTETRFQIVKVWFPTSVCVLMKTIARKGLCLSLCSRSLATCWCDLAGPTIVQGVVHPKITNPYSYISKMLHGFLTLLFDIPLEAFQDQQATSMHAYAILNVISLEDAGLGSKA